MTKDDASQLQQRMIDALERDAAALDGLTRQRLDRARRQALATAVRPKAQGWRAPLLAGAGLAAIMVVAVLFSWPGGRAVQPPPSADLDLLTSPAFDLLVEDPELYAWLIETAESEAEPVRAEHSG